MSQSIKKPKTGRPKTIMTKTDLREYLKLRSREYYKTPDAKEKQRLKMIKHRMLNKDKINARRRRNAMIKRLEKKLTGIWFNRGFIKV